MFLRMKTLTLRCQTCKSSLLILLVRLLKSNLTAILNVSFHNSDVDIYHQESAVKVKMNGVEVPTKNISYQHPTG